MQKKYCGVRIRPGDKRLVFKRMFLLWLSGFLLTQVPFYLIEYKTGYYAPVQVKEGLIHVMLPGFFYTLLPLVGVVVGFLLVIVYYRGERVRKLQHRQKLAKMLLENHWYESERVKDDGFFKDFRSHKQREKITYFPKIFYSLRGGLIRIQVEISMGKYQEQLLTLENKLESGFYCELTDKELHDAYVEYVLLYDMIANRISIDDVRAEHGKLRLMKNIWWEYDRFPHMLIAGGTGSGKTYLILTIIKALLATGAQIRVLDPKNSDLADLGAVMPNVYYKKDDMIACLNFFYEGMIERSEAMKHMKGYRTGENYAYLGLPAHFLVFDEYVAFMEMLGNKENQAVLNILKQIVMLGRQAGFFLILACQRPDAKYLGDGIRDQFNFRVALGKMSDMGYNMMFGETDKDFFPKNIIGRGYLDAGTNAITEFYAPLVSKGYDFLGAIEELTVRNKESEMEVHEDGNQIDGI